MSRKSLAHRPAWLLSLGLLILLILSFWIVRGAKGTDPWDGPDSDLIATGPIMDQQTANANFQDKTALQQQTAVAQQVPYNGVVTDKIADPNYVPPTSVPEPTVAKPTEIFTEGPLPIGWGALYQITNRWRGWVSTKYATVFAGAKVDDAAYQTWNNPNQGVLIVMTAPGSGSGAAPATDEYLTPTRHGAIQITAFSGTCLALSTVDGGTSYAFNVATRVWNCGTTNGPNP